MPTPKYQSTNAHFNTTLKERVNAYFAENNLNPHGNFSLYAKATLLVGLYFALYVQMVFFTPASFLVGLLECVALGVVTAGIGFNVMHDGVHGSFSNKKWLNNLAGITLNLLGASKTMWYNKHNLIHHTYTNIDGVDDDLEIQPFMRLCATQKHYKIHKYQHIYFWLLYSFLHIFWLFKSDFQKYFTQRIGDIPLKKMSTQEHTGFWIAKVAYMIFMFVIPIIKVGFLPWLCGFLTFSLVTGLLVSIIFQLAHTVEHTEFPMPNVITNKIENEWAIHQVETTANFATKSKLTTWFLGGLNFQIEHHLFPRISHVHYPALSKIVQQTAAEMGITYTNYKRTYLAVFSHIRYLKRMGSLQVQ
jgi:linoleoyl-CoA desaturase